MPLLPPRRSAPKISPQKKLLINADHPEECRAVVLNDGKIEEIIIERASRELGLEICATIVEAAVAKIADLEAKADGTYKQVTFTPEPLIF